MHYTFTENAVAGIIIGIIAAIGLIVGAYKHKQNANAEEDKKMYVC